MRHRGAARRRRSIEEFLVDYAAALTDWPALFAPFEAACGQKLRLADFDALAGERRIWEGFRDLAGLPSGLKALPGAPRYPSPDRESIALIRSVNMLVEDRAARRAVIHGYFALNPNPANRASLLPPARRQALLAAFAEHSANWAAERGYCPDISVLQEKLEAEKWAPAGAIDPARLADLLLAAQSSPALMQNAPPPTPARPATPPADGAVLRFKLRLRPWAQTLLRRWLQPRS